MLKTGPDPRRILSTAMRIFTARLFYTCTSSLFAALTTDSEVTKKSNEQTNGSEFRNCERLMRIIIIIIRFDLEEGMI